MAKLALIEWKEEEEEEPITEKKKEIVNNPILTPTPCSLTHYLVLVGKEKTIFSSLSSLPPSSGNHRRRRRLPIRGVADSPLPEEINLFLGNGKRPLFSIFGG